MMTSPDLAVVDRLYSLASAVQFRRHFVAYEAFGEFCVRLGTLRSQVGDQAQDQYWRKYFSDLRRLRFGLCAAPLLNSYRDSRIREIFGELSGHLRHIALIYPAQAQLALEVLTSMWNMQGDNLCPLAERLFEVSRDVRSAAWIIRESRLIPHVDDLLATYPSEATRIHVVHPSQLTSSATYDLIAVVGSPSWFPESVFTAPRAPTIDIVQFNWIRDDWSMEPAFAGGSSVQGSERPTIVNLSDPVRLPSYVPADRLLLNSESERLAVAIEQKQHHDYEEVEARCIILEGEHALFIDASASQQLFVIDLDDEATERVKRIGVGSLVPGTFIPVRTGGGDYIVPLADQILGDRSPKLRQAQAEWKLRLREHVEQNGLLKTSIGLLDCGSFIANEVNVRNWINPRNIRTRDRRDFNAILALVGLNKRQDELWKMMEVISNAHQRAGFRLREMLLEKVDTVPADEFRRLGRIDIKLSDDDREPSLTVFRVEQVLNKTYRVSFHDLGIPFRLGHEPWPE